MSLICPITSGNSMRRNRSTGPAPSIAAASMI
jgi:hypothetical protein